jgi:hypothetical protein
MNVGALERSGLWRDQLVAERLMVPLRVVVRDELVEGAAQATFPEDDESVETLRTDRAREPFRAGVGESSRLQQMRAVRRRLSG